MQKAKDSTVRSVHVCVAGGVLLKIVSERYYEPSHVDYTNELDAREQEMVAQGRWKKENFEVVEKGYLEHWSARVTTLRKV